MGILDFLQTESGLAFLYFIQSLLFFIMVYILSAEYIRTRRHDLVYKLVACGSILIINVATTLIHLLNIFYNIVFSQKYFPLIFNSIFSIIVLALARAFIYDYVANKTKFEKIIHGGMLGAVVMYILLQLYWLGIYEPSMVFSRSYLQLFYVLFFLIVLFISIYYLLKYRTSYKLRLIIAFLAIVTAQFVNMYSSIFHELPPLLAIVKASVPFFVPLMFGSVIFKELIESVVTMVDHLNNVLEIQRELSFDLMKLGSELSVISDDLVKNSLKGWHKLSFVVEKICSQEEGTDKLLNLTEKIDTDIQKMRLHVNDMDYNNGKVNIDAVDFEPDDEQQSVIGSIKKLENYTNSVCGTYERREEINKDLERSIKSIEKSLFEIEEVSDKTSMLALNASIEAAKAGQQGSGFAVVAEEINKLAERSQRNSDEINRSLKDIIKIVKTINSSASGIIDRTGETLNEIRKIYNYFIHSVKISRLYEFIVYQNSEINKLHSDSAFQVDSQIKATEKLIRDNRMHGVEMKNAISNHIREIEAMAGLSDYLNELINNLNNKTNMLIKNAKNLQDLTK